MHSKVVEELYDDVYKKTLVGTREEYCYVLLAEF